MSELRPFLEEKDGKVRLFLDADDGTFTEQGFVKQGVHEQSDWPGFEVDRRGLKVLQAQIDKILEGT